jgi:hypothetical protein
VRDRLRSAKLSNYFGYQVDAMKLLKYLDDLVVQQMV